MIHVHAVSLAGLIHGLLFRDGDIPPGLKAGNNLLAARREAIGKKPTVYRRQFYLVGWFSLLGLIGWPDQPRSTPDGLFVAKSTETSSVDAISTVPMVLEEHCTGRTVWLATGDDVYCAALMRGGWLKGQFSFATIAVICAAAIGVIIILPSPRNGDLAVVARLLTQMPRTAAVQAITCVAVLWLRPQLSRLLCAGNVGRMALTNYLLQTLICTYAFYQFVYLCSLSSG